MRSEYFEGVKRDQLIQIYTFFFFSWHTLLEHSCVHHWSPGLPVGCLLPCRRERPIFSGFKSISVACSQVWLGLPFGRFQSKWGFWIADATDCSLWQIHMLSVSNICYCGRYRYADLGENGNGTHYCMSMTCYCKTDLIRQRPILLLLLCLLWNVACWTGDRVIK